MLLGFCIGILGFLFFGLAAILGFFPYLFLKMEIVVINFFGNLKFAIISLGEQKELIFWLAIIILLLFSAYLNKKYLKNLLKWTHLINQK